MFKSHLLSEAYSIVRNAHAGCITKSPKQVILLNICDQAVVLELWLSNSIRRRASLILKEKQIANGEKSGCNFHRITKNHLFYTFKWYE